MTDRRLLFELRKAAHELQGRSNIDPRAGEIAHAVETVISKRKQTYLAADENAAMDVILQYFIAVRTQRISRPPPIDFSRPIFSAPWIQAILRKRR